MINKLTVLVSVLCLLCLGTMMLNAVKDADWLVNTEIKTGEGRLMRFPDITNNKIAFVYAGDIYIVSDKGGVASKLTSDAGLELFPKFSPDSNTIAFTGQYEGNFNVYAISVNGGEPRQLTYNPDVQHEPERMGPNNMVIEWFPDGKHILYRSRQNTFNTWICQYYKISVEGGLQEQLPLPEGGLSSFSSDGNRIAYNRIFRNFRTWKKYFGGLAQDVWIYDFKNNKSERITDWKGTDSFPMWHQNKIYFTSDRDENVRLNIWSYDLASKEFKQITFFKDYDVNWPSIGGDRIVFESGGYLYVLDLKTEKTQRISVELQTDKVQALSTWVDASKLITRYDVAPDGKRAVFEARGDIFTVPAEKGSIRNLTNTSGAHEKAPVWSPDGKSIAYISDKSGEDELYVILQKGDQKAVQITTDGSVYRYEVSWSPDSQKLLFADKSKRLWYADVTRAKPVLIDEDKFWEMRDYVWSPDSKWVAYAKHHENQLTSIFLFSLESSKITEVTSSFTNNHAPYFDPEGRYLYFISDRHYNAAMDGKDENFIYQKNEGIYLVTLKNDILSPFAPSSDESDISKDNKKEQEKAAENKEKGNKNIKEKAKEIKKEPFRIDLQSIGNRVVAVPVVGGNYGNLQANKNSIFYMSFPVFGLSGPYPRDKKALYRFDLEKKKEILLMDGISSFTLSANGEKLLYESSKDGSNKIFGIIKSDIENEAKTGDGVLDFSRMKMKVNLHEEWKQMFNEAWRLQRDFFYNSEMNGINWKTQYDKYSVLVPYIATRFDLVYILGEMFGELGNSHTYVGGGDYPELKMVNVGMLGADYEFDTATGLYRIKKIYPGDNSRAEYRSPLTEPGVNVKEGEYLLSVNNIELKAPVNLYSLFENTAGETVVLKVNSKPELAGAREVLVKPLDSEFNLKYLDWIESNRQKVEKASGGKIGYVYLPNMSEDGLNEFQRQFFPQIRKEGLIIDERYNGGGFVDQMILERLRRILIGMGMSRNGADNTIPAQVFNGYLACLENQYSASDGDIFPFYFKQYKLGPVIGERTWGGVRGIRGYTPLIDGGYITMPEFAIYGLDSQWVIENYGVAPDIEIDNLPETVIAGKDLQLEKGIDYLMQKIKEAPKKLPERPKNLPAFPPEGM